MSNKVVMYAGGSIVTNYSTLLGSGFTTVILNSLHVHSDGSLWMNDTEVVDANGNAQALATLLGTVVQALRGGGITTVLISIGGGGSFKPNPNGINGWHSVSDGDFQAINGAYWSATGMPTPLYPPVNSDPPPQNPKMIPLLNNLTVLLQTVGADGIDLDPEPMFYTYGQMLSATVLLTEWALARQSGVATWVPYEAQSSWEAYAQALSQDAGQQPSWVNLQWWSSGSDLQGWAKAIGVPVNLIVPGFMNGQDPAEIQSQLAEVVNGGTKITGAYIWNFDGITATPTALAQAINQGLAGNSSGAASAKRTAGATPVSMSNRNA